MFGAEKEKKERTKSGEEERERRSLERPSRAKQKNIHNSLRLFFLSPFFSTVFFNSTKNIMAPTVDATGSGRQVRLGEREREAERAERERERDVGDEHFKEWEASRVEIQCSFFLSPIDRRFLPPSPPLFDLFFPPRSVGELRGSMHGRGREWLEELHATHEP